MSPETEVRDEEVTDDGVGAPGSEDAAAPLDEDAERGKKTTDASENAEEPVSLLVATVVAGLGAAAVAWMVGGVFEGWNGRLVGIAGAAIGAGAAGWSYRSRLSTLIQFLILPLLLVVGAVLVIPYTGGGSSLPDLVLEAVRAGGLNDPPVLLAPGWQVIIILLTGLIAAGGTAIGVASNRPNRGLLVAIPVVFGAALVQSADATYVSSLGALLFAIGAMAVGFGADLASTGASSGNFEARRLVKGAVVLVGVLVLLGGLSRLGFLFPEVEEDTVVEPREPEIPPPSPDRELFQVQAPVAVPWRLGVLDVYGIEEQAWLTAPYRRSQLIELAPGDDLTFVGDDPAWATVVDRPVGRDGRTLAVTFTVSDVPGQTIPGVANAVDLQVDEPVNYDPRTQVLTVTAPRARPGLTYTLTMAAPPVAADLQKSEPPPERLAEFLVAPEPPAEVDRLLASAPTGNPFDRLQFVRNSLYANVVAAGAGEPVDLPPRRVAELLAGGEGTPYEITAAEVLLARWAGVPARIGYGYFGGDQIKDADDTWSIRPAHGAMWLEAYFEGHGWVPIIGTPPKAKASLSDDEKREDPSVRATDEIALIVYVPIKLQTFQLLFEIVRFWAVRVLPIVIAAVLAYAFYPALLRLARRTWRRRWAHARGPAERVAVAYTELRDLCNDYNFGDVMHTPLEFVGDFRPDAEHRELAWLVTRAIWGDLARDLRDRDAEIAEELSASLVRRLKRANNGVPRLIALASRASLKHPYTAEVPNLWPRRIRLSLRGRVRSGARRLRRLLPARATATLVLVLALASGGCTQTIDLTTSGATTLPDPVVPAALGDYVFEEEPDLAAAYERPDSLVAEGAVYTIHDGPNVQGSLQVGVFKAGLRGIESEVRQGVVATLGTGSMELTRVGSNRVYVGATPDQHFLLWVAPTGTHYQLLALRREFDEGPQLMSSILAFQQGESDGAAPLVPVPDPRRMLHLEGLSG